MPSETSTPDIDRLRELGERASVDMRPAWTFVNGLAFCPVCQEHIGAGTEDFDWGCGHCGYPDQQAVKDYEDQCDDEF